MPDFSHPCPTCGVNIQFPEEQTGEAAQCPICATPVTLIPQPPVHDDFAKLELALIEPEPAQPLVVAPAIQPIPPATSPPVIAPMIEPPRAAIERKNEFIGSGCILQAIGLAMLPAAIFLPIGLAVISGVVGLALLIYGSRISSFLRCSLCKGKIEKGASVCPHCNAYLSA